ncbi:MAG: hypothetical protein F4Y45_18530 [Acidobacteria bacterium]|nr:hypothetical protein [Acidobacteriota bacterium]MYJ03002.1 hypothetical protein [Acidobacteriota bacterium]
MNEVDRIRQLIWTALVEPAIQRGQSQVMFDWQTVVDHVRAAGIRGNQANIQNALESWDDRRISVRWMGQRRGRDKRLAYVIDVAD